jgi:pimeloyl-ACP methyl ester carboxylesterase
MAVQLSEAYRDPLDVVGVSMGGMVAQHLALVRPNSVHSLILICTSPRANRVVMEERARAVEQGGMAAVVEPTLQRWFSRAALVDPAHEGVAYAREQLLRTDPVTFAEAWRAIGEHDVVDRLREITSPVTVVAGASDASVSPQALPLFRAGLPRARLEMLDGPHMLPLERPDAVRDAIQRHLRWVQKVDAGSQR